MKRAALAFILLLGACGLREPLRPAPGQSMPPAPSMANRALTTDELLRRSEEREDDRFDLPPGDIPVDDGPANTAEAPE